MQPPDTIGQLAIQVLIHNVAAFDEHTPGTQAGQDARSVHQMRVATRRMRAALRLFADVLPQPDANGLNDELKWIADLLGAKRDLDVQARRVRERAAELGLSEALVPFGAWLEDQRQHAQADLASGIASPRFTQLAAQLHALDRWAPNPENDAPLYEDAPGRLQRTYRKLRKRAKRIDAHAPAPALHKVRIRAKWLRYAAEFFEVAYGKSARRLARRVGALQDLLGDLQDGVVSGQRIHQAVHTEAGAWPAETSVALGRVVQRDVQRAGQIRKEFPNVYRKITDAAWPRLARLLE